MQNRAKLFMPFDALKGFNEAIKRVEDKHDNKYVSYEETIDIIKKLNINDRVEITYFNNFESITLIGQIKTVDYKKKLIRVSNSIISFDDIDYIKKRL